MFLSFLLFLSFKRTIIVYWNYFYSHSLFADNRSNVFDLSYYFKVLITDVFLAWTPFHINCLWVKVFFGLNHHAISVGCFIQVRHQTNEFLLFASYVIRKLIMNLMKNKMICLEGICNLWKIKWRNGAMPLILIWLMYHFINCYIIWQFVQRGKFFSNLINEKWN